MGFDAHRTPPPMGILPEADGVVALVRSLVNGSLIGRSEVGNALGHGHDLGNRVVIGQHEIEQDVAEFAPGPRRDAVSFVFGSPGRRHARSGLRQSRGILSIGTYPVILARGNG